MRRALALAALLGLAACAADPAAPPPTAPRAPSASACDGSFRVTNGATRVASRLQLRDAALTNWGPDLLGREVLPPGGTSNLRAPSPGVYDMRVIWADRQEMERRRITICSGTLVSLGNFGINAP
jgi:hypothetical protein